MERPTSAISPPLRHSAIYARVKMAFWFPWCRSPTSPTSAAASSPSSAPPLRPSHHRLSTLDAPLHLTAHPLTHQSRQTGRQAGRQADRQAGRQAGRQTGMQTGRQGHQQPSPPTDHPPNRSVTLRCGEKCCHFSVGFGRRAKVEREREREGRDALAGLVRSATTDQPTTSAAKGNARMCVSLSSLTYLTYTRTAPPCPVYQSFPVSTPPQ
ncbi:uncharacterized protein J3D65DRAFT_437663 [Phyllosticta citribraziliensis]|uniref:Uncharacterized protein n=1 Tax=Phyllosticta citribraziliensis TaxID=989973 RepID=A0ABR1LKL5_9PEZI